MHRRKVHEPSPSGKCPVLKRRKPTLLLRLSDELLLRFADRVFWALLLKLPPRITRLEPVVSSSSHSLPCAEEIPAQMQGVRMLEVSQHTFHGLHTSAFIELSFAVCLLPLIHLALKPSPA